MMNKDKRRKAKPSRKARAHHFSLRNLKQHLAIAAWTLGTNCVAGWLSASIHQKGAPGNG